MFSGSFAKISGVETRLSIIQRIGKERRQPVKRQSITLQCQEGLHLRVASKVALIAQKAGGSVNIRSDKHRRAVNACSVLELLTLGATLGTPLEIVAECPNEDHIVQELVGVFDADRDT